jgi:hypothetical protein
MGVQIPIFYFGKACTSAYKAFLIDYLTLCEGELAKCCIILLTITVLSSRIFLSLLYPSEYLS